MSAAERASDVVRRLTPGTALVSWLAGSPRGRWATTPGRWVQVLLTAGLLLTGLSAWALALVQPWATLGGDPGAVSIAEGLDTAKMRSMSADGERACPEYQPPAPRALRRDPFAGAAARRAVLGGAATPASPSGAKSVPAAAPGAPTSAAARVLETVKTLRLEVTLVAPTGERWAVINGADYREGDAIAGLEIMEIQDGKVRLQQGGLVCLLRME